VQKLFFFLFALIESFRRAYAILLPLFCLVVALMHLSSIPYPPAFSAFVCALTNANWGCGVGLCVLWCVQAQGAVALPPDFAAKLDAVRFADVIL